MTDNSFLQSALSAPARFGRLRITIAGELHVIHRTTKSYLLMYGRFACFLQDFQRHVSEARLILHIMMVRMLHSHDGRNDGSPCIRQQPTRASGLSHKDRTSCMKNGQLASRCQRHFVSLWENSARIALTIADTED